ncbi:MAG: FG-GAP-like repeat-containing protein [Pseudomonadota bacterium]
MHHLAAKPLFNVLSSAASKTLFLVLATALLLGACSRKPEPLTAEQIARNNEGVALMGQYQNEDARAVFAVLTNERPDIAAFRVNEAIATLNRNNEGDEQRALAMVREVLETEPDNRHAAYIAGLMNLYIGDAEPALARFEQVGKLQSEDPYVDYFAGQALDQLGRTDDALARYQRAIELDPYLRSAYYGAALALRRTGDATMARKMLDDYRRLERNPRAKLAEFRYTRFGPLGEAIAMGPIDGTTPVVEPVEGPVFGEARRVARLPGGGATMTVADLDTDGRVDLFLARADGASVVLAGTEDGGFSRVDNHPLANIDGVSAAAWGIPDVSDDLAVYLCRRGDNQLLQRGDDGWAPAPGDADIRDGGDCADVAAADADHDGDLDWLVVNRDGANELFSNNLNGSYRRLSQESGALIAGNADASRQVLITDFDRDGDADLVVLNDAAPHQAIVNDRLWQYRAAEGFDAFRRADLVTVAAADLGADGQVELIAIDRTGDLVVWAPDDAGVWQPSRAVTNASEDPDSAALVAIDVTGNGALDVVVHDATGWSVLGQSTSGSWDTLQREAVPLVALTPVVSDAATGPTLAGIVEGSDGHELLVWPAGSGRHNFITLTTTGRSYIVEDIRSNPSGIGTEIALRVGNRWTLTDTFDRHSAPGQSLQPIAFGLGGAEQADFVRLTWSDGVLQTELALAAGEQHVIEEYQRQLASCPVLFAWNGEQTAFVSDVLGVAAMGFFVSPGVSSTPRPWEYFEFPDGAIAPRDGRYIIKITEPMQEIAYVDQVRLHTYDLPEGWSMTLDERLHTGGGPAPTGRPMFFRDASQMLPKRVVTDRGEEVTTTVTEADAVAAPPGERDPRFLGRLSGLYTLTLEFDAVINPAGSEPVLVADGWIEYPYSQTVFSAWQSGASYAPPSLEAFADGVWQPVFEHFGLPGGMPREMALPLADLPANTTALRISTLSEVYWDRLAVVHAETPPTGSVVSHVAQPAVARLRKTGFAKRELHAQRRPWYAYEDRAAYWDTAYAQGQYTALGPVEPLVDQLDDAFALVGPGEELHLEFDAPDDAAGGRRIVVAEIRGYAKDMDLYTEDGDQVGPLPTTPGLERSENRDKLHATYLTRSKGGY